jgi:hypothetical protein
MDRKAVTRIYQLGELVYNVNQRSRGDGVEPPQAGYVSPAAGRQALGRPGGEVPVEETETTGEPCCS